MYYDIKRNNTIVATVSPKGNQDKKIMADNISAMNFFLEDHVEFKIGDHTEIYGETYYLNYSQPVKEHHSEKWEYNMTFQAIPYDLIRAKFFGYSTTNVLNEPGPTITATASVIVDLIIANLTRTQPGWIKGDIDETETLTLQFNPNDNCLAVLSRLAEEFKTEYWIEGKTIHLTKKGDILATTLEYGPGKGLRSIERVPLDQNPPITMLYVYGSTRNLPAGYRNYSKQLKLPVASAPNGYLSANVDLYGIREDVYINDEIYPKREGTVTATGAINKITDSGLDFDINSPDVLIPGTSAKIKFLTGQLAGYTFEIQQGGYNVATKTITFNDNKDEKAFTVPSNLLKPAVGDKWMLLDVIMPQSYVTQAEADLLADGTLYLSQNSGSRFNYPITVDPFHFERQGIVLKLGTYVRVKSTEFGLDENLRIVGYSRDLQNPFLYNSVEVSNSIQFNAAVIANTKQREIENVIKINRLNDVQRARNNWRTTAELTTMLDTVKAEMLLIMVEGGAYSTDVASTVSALHFSVTAGTIQHEEYVQSGGLWDVSAFSAELTGGAKYIYIRASKASTTATFVMSETKIGIEAEAGYYHFPFGIISGIINNTRIFNTTKGYVRINGNNIQAGRIISTDGTRWFDLDTGEIRGDFSFTSGVNIESLIDEIIDDALSLTDSLGDLAYKQSVTDAMEDESILVGGFFKNSLINTDLLVSKVVKTATTGARIEIYGNTMDSYNPNNKLARRQTVEEGVVKDIWYNLNGDRVYEVGQNGIVYVNSVPQSWTPSPLRLVSSNESQTFTSLVAAINTPTNICQKSGYVGTDKTLMAYFFNAGQGGSAEGNRPYEGYKTGSELITSGNISDGWYINADTFFMPTEGTNTYILEFMHVVGGKITEGLSGQAVLTSTHTCSFEADPF